VPLTVALDPPPAAWDAFVHAHRDAHLLQTATWGTLKAAFGYTAQRIAVMNGANITAGALILYRRLPLGMGTRAYLPAGPLLASDDAMDPTTAALWQAIHRAARRQRAVFLKVEPCDWYRQRPALSEVLTQAGLRSSSLTEQPPRTIVLDISDAEDSILKRMNQSTRRKVKLKDKKDIAVRQGTAADVASFTQLMAITSQRDAFGAYDAAYYERAFALFAPSDHCALLLASHQGHDLAGLMVFRCGTNAYYLYGASSNEERNRMPTYILQLEAIRWAKQHGAQRYDLWGIPDEAEATLEAQFGTRHDGLWGVYKFKRGFGGQVVRSVGAWDMIYNPLLYRAYLWLMQRRKQQQPEIVPAVLDADSD
jgi:peptidoglycan pentaglycine glycine transferase (the first glycine)